MYVTGNKFVNMTEVMAKTVIKKICTYLARDK